MTFNQVALIKFLADSILQRHIVNSCSQVWTKLHSQCLKKYVLVIRLMGRFNHLFLAPQCLRTV